MTNFDYIKDNIKETDIAYFLFPHDLALRDRPRGISERIYGAWDKWAESASSNRGNMAAGIHGKTIINEDPSIGIFRIGTTQTENGEGKVETTLYQCSYGSVNNTIQKTG